MPEETQKIELGSIVSLDMPTATEPLPAAAQTAPAAPAFDVEKYDAARIAAAKEITGKDSLGREFDPAKFRPEKDAIGRWKNAKAGRKPLPGKAPKAAPQVSFVAPDAPAAPSPSPTPPPAAGGPETPPAAPAPVPVVDRFRMLGTIYTKAGISAAMGLFSEEWAPDTEEEFSELRDLVAEYLRLENMTELSPKAALAVGVLTYAAKRLPRPKTQGRLAYFREKGARFFAWLKGRRIAATVAAVGGAA